MMLNVLVAYDDNDFELGDYFIQSYESLRATFDVCNDISCRYLPGLDCTQEQILKEVTAFNSNFAFVGLSHGNAEQLLTSNSVYVCTSNPAHFCNSFFYSTACSTGIVLGVNLIQIGCKTFVGYAEDAWVSEEHLHQVYIECELYGLKKFVEEGLTADEAFNAMLSYFTDEILRLEAEGEIIAAIELTKNRDALVLLGDKHLTRGTLLD